MRDRLDGQWIIGAAAAVLVLSATLFALSSVTAGAATCDIKRFTDSGGKVDVTSYLQCQVPSVTPNPVAAGATQHFSAGNFASNSPVRIELHSLAVTLANITTNAQGNFATDVTIPRSTTLGSHELWAVGIDPTNAPLTVVMPITVIAPTGTLPVTGRNIGQYGGLGLALVTLGGAVVWGVRRERSTVDA